jgi:hypothetical protein
MPNIGGASLTVYDFLVFSGCTGFVTEGTVVTSSFLPKLKFACETFKVDDQDEFFFCPLSGHGVGMS